MIRHIIEGRHYVSRTATRMDGLHHTSEPFEKEITYYGTFVSPERESEVPLPPNDEEINASISPLQAEVQNNASSTEIGQKAKVRLDRKTDTEGTEEKERDLTFILLLLFCFLGALTSGYLFYRSFFRIATRNSSPIAHITFKYKSAQRKFVDSVSWDRIQQNSAIYNGDTIHTGDLSEATIVFADGNIIELSDNSMVQVFLNEKGEAGASLSSGNARVNASSSSSGIALTSGGVSVSVTAGSSVSATTEDGDVALQVVKGNAQVTGADGDAQTMQAGDATSTANLVMLYPLPNQKLLYHDEGDYTAQFKWQYNTEEGDETNVQVVLEIASDKDYKNIIKQVATDTDAVSIALSANKYYWRLKPATGNGGVIEGRVNIVQSLPPVQVSPVADYVYTYRTKQGAMRFIWTESSLATSYEFRLSRNSDMSDPIITQRTAQTSLILQSVSEDSENVPGVYYWQVIPFYMLDNRGLEAPSAISTFKIERRTALPSPTLYLPTDKSAVNIGDGAKQVNFSWKADNEAESYHIMVYDDATLNHPIIDTKTNINRYVAQCQVFTANTPYWWRASLLDSEGNESAASESRMFTAMNGVAEQHLVEPPDGYTVTDNLARELNFTWYKKMPYGLTTRLQVSRDEGFGELLYNEAQDGLSKSALNLTAGKYYWRIRTTDDSAADIADAFNMATSGRRLVVVPPLPAAVVITPVDKAITSEDSTYRFMWRTVEGAEFYRIAIYDKESGKSIYSDVVYAPHYDIDMFHDNNFRHRAYYRYEIQGEASDNPGIASRRSGNVSAGNFQFIRLQPVVILSPKNGAALDGINAMINGIVVRYDTADPLRGAQVILSRLDNGGGSTVMLKSPTDSEVEMGKAVAPKEVTLNTPGGIMAGAYEVTINAISIDGIDVSATASKGGTRFTVLPIPPLPTPNGFEANPQVINKEFLTSGDTRLTLSWLPVDGATDYDVAVMKEGGKTIARSSITWGSDGEADDGLTYSIDIMSLDDETRALFATGSFTCTVTPYRRVDSRVVQAGDATVTHFSADIPVPKESTTTGAIKPFSLSGK